MTLNAEPLKLGSLHWKDHSYKASVPNQDASALEETTKMLASSRWFNLRRPHKVTHTHNYPFNSKRLVKSRGIETVLLRGYESIKSAASHVGVSHWRLVGMSERKRPAVVKA